MSIYMFGVYIEHYEALLTVNIARGLQEVMLLFPLCTRTRLLWLSYSFCLLSALVRIIQADSAEKFYAIVEGLAPHVFISVLVTNSMHALPNFLGYLEGLDYPKDRISVW